MRGRTKEPALKLLETLVNTDSGSGDDKGLNAVAEAIVSQLKPLGAQVETLKPAEPAKGTNVVATWTGTGQGTILLIGHMDTVFPEGTAAVIDRSLPAKPPALLDHRDVSVALGRGGFGRGARHRG